MSSERRPKRYKYWNLHAVVMSDYSLTATRNSHAKHKKSVGRIPERGQTRLLFPSKWKFKVEMQREMSVLKRHLRAISMETIHVFQVTCQQTQVSHVSNT